MRFALYGMPCAGKTTLMNSIAHRLVPISGSQWLNDNTDGQFHALSEAEKHKWRVRYTQYLASRDDDLISDGHYAFEDQVVFSPEDGAVYDVFFYLYCDPALLWERMQTSHKNSRFAHLRKEDLARWQDREIRELRRHCQLNERDFHVLPATTVSKDDFALFVEDIIAGLNCCAHAGQIAEQIISWFPDPCELHIVDGDRTLICQDSFRICAPEHRTNVFDGNFYTGFQSWLFAREIAALSLDTGALERCRLNTNLKDTIGNDSFVVLSAGLTGLWDNLAARFNLRHCIASPLISADTKYHTVRILREKGYTITAWGDSCNDWYMLGKADRGMLCLNGRISRSLEGLDCRHLHLFCPPAVHILTDALPPAPVSVQAQVHKAAPDGTAAAPDAAAAQDAAAAPAAAPAAAAAAADVRPGIDLFDESTAAQIRADIAICKSDSGINGHALAQAHLNLGRIMGQQMRKMLPHERTPVLVLQRGGYFFGAGVYLGFGGCFCPFKPEIDPIPEFTGNFAVIADSVINTGRSILRLIDALRARNPDLTVCLVANVVQNNALELLKEHMLFTVRVSSNSFTGRRQHHQTGNTGPDTADRLFNLLDGPP